MNRPFRCKVCFLRFRSLGSLKRHYDERHGPIPCRKCHKHPAKEEGLCFICGTYRRP
jgi:hypothetical protein